MNEALLTNFFVAMLAIVNPFGKIPRWLQACEGEDVPVSRRLALFVTLTGFAILALALVAGRSALGVFGIDLAAFRIGGGIVILVIAIGMVQGESLEVDSADEDGETDPIQRAKARFRSVVVPLALPLLAGPGSITTAVVYGARAESWLERALMGGVLAVVMAVVLLALLAAPRIRDLVGDLALEVQTRLFGMILAAVAVQLMVEGLGEVFPDWLAPGSPIVDDVEESMRSQPADS